MTEKEPYEWLENLIAVAIAVIVVVIVLGLIFGWFKGLFPKEEEQPDVRVPVSIDDDPMLGDFEAPVTIIEFSDFECEYCAWFANEVEPQLQSYFDSGEVCFVFRDFPLLSHPKAGQVAKAAGCAAEQDRFWEYHDLLYANMEAHEISDLRSYAEELGLDMELYDSCFASDHRYDEIEEDIREGEAAGVTGTPTFFINGRKIVGAMEFPELETAIQEELTTVKSG